ncbi:MAG: hypothetical protein JWN71_3228 [Xanthobacteraceae bacterium]|nr:hypothetical protein [Xanthobacteraceae bacterium]
MTASKERADLEEACFELARTTKWVQKPIDAAEIQAQASRFAEIAKVWISEPLDIDLPLITRAIRYLSQAHGMPRGDNIYWFEDILGTLIEIARPNTGLDERGREFLQDMADGINSIK